jgi:hypothetical protein
MQLWKSLNAHEESKGFGVRSVCLCFGMSTGLTRSPGIILYFHYTEKVTSK